jgi:hypothetical protein
MSDDVTLPGTGEVIAADDVSSVFYQRVKLDVGADGVSDPVVGALPIVGTVATPATATWTSATPDETALTLDVRGYGSATITVIADAGSFSNGVLTTKASGDGSTYQVTAGSRSLNSGTPTSSSTFVLDVSNTAVWQFGVGGFTHVAIVLTTPIVGTGTIAVTISAGLAAPTLGTLGAVLASGSTTTVTQSTPANLNAAVIGSIAHDSPAATSGLPLLIGGFASSTAPSNVSTNNDAVRGWFIPNGAQATVITAAGALVGGDATNGLDVDVTRIVAELPAGTQNIGDVDVLTVPAPLNVVGSGTQATALRVTLATDSPTSSTAVTNAGVFAVQENATAASTMNATSSDGGTALTSTAQVIKGSAGTLHGYYVYNPNATAQFVQIFNTAAASVTVGTTTPLFMLTIPATSAANLWMSPVGVAFGTAMSWAATSTAGGNGAPTTALDAVAGYK